MTLSEILNILLGGGLIAVVVALATMRATVRKANAEAERARADAESVRITNTENATRILVENIVKPLKEELNATREDLQATKKEMAATKREMARLRKAVESASGCRHADDCPVLGKLRDNAKERDVDVDGEREERREPHRDEPGDADGDGGSHTGGKRRAGDSVRQP
nr:MAG TPA: Transcriptional regulator, MerR-family, MerR family, Transcription activator.01A [Caudoviricetes sp.]